MTEYSIIIISKTKSKELLRCIKSLERADDNQTSEIFVCCNKDGLNSESISINSDVFFENSLSECISKSKGKFIAVIPDSFIAAKNLFTVAEKYTHSDSNKIICGNTESISENNDDKLSILFPYGRFMPCKYKHLLSTADSCGRVELCNTMLEYIKSCGGIAFSDDVMFYSDRAISVNETTADEISSGKFLENFMSTDRSIFKAEVWHDALLAASDFPTESRRISFLTDLCEYLIKSKEFLILNMLTLSAVYRIYLNRNELDEKSYKTLQKYIYLAADSGMCSVLLKNVFGLENEMLEFFINLPADEFSSINEKTSAKSETNNKSIADYKETEMLISEMCRNAEIRKNEAEKRIAENEGNLNKRLLMSSFSCDPVSDIYNIFAEGSLGLRALIAAIKGYISYKMSHGKK